MSPKPGPVSAKQRDEKPGLVARLAAKLDGASGRAQDRVDSFMAGQRDKARRDWEIVKRGKPEEGG